ncbi:hypothetical protein Tco_0591123 [Tanacetum coccineum]
MTRLMSTGSWREKLNHREDANGGISNFIGRIKGMHVFVGNFTYVVDFMIVEDISSILDPRYFSTWMAFGGNTRDLSSFGEETDKITDLHQFHEEILFTERKDGVAGIKRRHRDLSSDGIRDLATTSGRGRLKEDLESFA